MRKWQMIKYLIINVGNVNKTFHFFFIKVIYENKKHFLFISIKPMDKILYIELCFREKYKTIIFKK